MKRNGRGRAVVPRVAVAIIVLLATGCSLSSPQLLGSDTLPPGQRAELSALAYYPARDLKLQVFKVDGKKVDVLRSPSFHLPPGDYVISIYATAEARIVSGSGGGLATSMKTAMGEAPLTMVAGHTYVPSMTETEGGVQFGFVDMGVGVPRECLPFYVQAERMPSLVMYRHEKVCGR